VSRRGFTIIELLMAVVVMAILGTALTRMLISDSRFVSRQDAMVSSRHGSRAAMNVLSVDLRMVGDGGLLAATRDSVMVEVPYAFGMTCNPSGPDLVASLMPPDSLTYATKVADGMAWRTNAGTYTVIPGVTVASHSDAGPCDADSVRVVSGGSLIAISGIPGPPPPPGQIFYLYQTVTYRFSASSELPGRLALWRKEGTAAYEEFVVPFDTSAGFWCLVGPDSDVENCPPAGGLNAVTGLELRLHSASERVPQGASDYEVFYLSTQVSFRNKVF
jgi:prepilin-type N-terminal cleavage/methylation domain-containing protein